MEKTVSGLKIEGEWEKVVEKSEEISKRLKKIESKEKFNDWEYWRPRNNEKINKQIKQRTIEMACTNEGPIENSEKSPKNELKNGITYIKESISKKGQNPQKLKKGLNKIALTLQSILRKSFRTFEEKIYKHIISKTNPQYFDGEKVSASLDQKNKITRKNPKYILQINIKDDELCEEIQEGLTA